MDSTFRSIFDIRSAAPTVSHEDKILTLGSCFSSEIGLKLRQTGFDVLVNPFGISFHPLAINAALRRALDVHTYTSADLIEVPGGLVTFDHHGSFIRPNPEVALEEMNEALKRAHHYLQSSDLLMITWGTAWGYWVEGRSRPVNNCHKLPVGLFKKHITESGDLVNDTAAVINAIRKSNPNISIELTVSPVRHLRDGAVQNNLSKSHLIAAAHRLCAQFRDVHYFPAYELVIDDLRDYRFFKTDRMHPTDEAVQYVWQRYRKARMNEASSSAVERIEKLRMVLEHRPSDEKAHAESVASALEKINDLLAPWGRQMNY